MTAPATSVAEPKQASVWEDFVDVFYTPATVFLRRREGKFGLALVVLTALFAATFFATRPLMEPIFDRSFQQAIEGMRAQGMTEDQIASARPMIERMQGLSMSVGGVIGMPLLVLLGALIAWLAAKPFGSTASFGQTMMVGTYANVPRVVGALIGAVILMFMDVSQLPALQQMSVGPALLLPRDASPVLIAVAQRLDVFTLWTSVLYGIGLSVVGKISRGQGLAASALGWAIATIFGVLMALRQVAASG